MKNDQHPMVLTEAEYVEMMCEFESAGQWMREQQELKRDLASTGQTPDICCVSNPPQHEGS